MDKYTKFIFDNVVCYIAKKFLDTTGKPITQTKLYKLLAYYDFDHLKNVGVPALDINWVAMQNGPVPIDLYDDIQQNRNAEKYKIEQGYKNAKEVRAITEPDMDYISDYQKEILDKWIYIFKESKTQDYSDASHDPNGGILAWRCAWQNKPAGKKINQMNYIDEFKDDVPDRFYSYLAIK